MTRLYEAAYLYAHDVLALPVKDIDRATKLYAGKFGLEEVERRDESAPAVIMQRDSVRIGFAVNGRDPRSSS